MIVTKVEFLLRPYLAYYFNGVENTFFYLMMEYSFQRQSSLLFLRAAYNVWSSCQKLVVHLSKFTS